MRKIVNFALLIVMATTIWSCQKETIMNTDENKSKKEIPTSLDDEMLLKDMDSTFLSKRMFTNEQIDSLGIYHNQLLSQCYIDFNYDNPNPKEEFLSQFDLHASSVGLVHSELNYGMNVDSMVQVLQNNLSSEASDLVLQIKQAAENFTDVPSFNDEINNIELDILENTVGKETDIMLSLCSVIKRSAYFWASVDAGGSGEGFAILENFYTRYGNPGNGQNYNTLGEKSLAREVGYALITDGFSASMASLGIAVACIVAGPPGWTGLVITYGTAVMSSGFSAFVSWVRHHHADK